MVFFLDASFVTSSSLEKDTAFVSFFPVEEKTVFDIFLGKDILLSYKKQIWYMRLTFFEHIELTPRSNAIYCMIPTKNVHSIKHQNVGQVITKSCKKRQITVNTPNQVIFVRYSYEILQTSLLVLYGSVFSWGISTSTKRQQFTT